MKLSRFKRRKCWFCEERIHETQDWVKEAHKGCYVKARAAGITREAVEILRFSAEEVTKLQVAKDELAGPEFA